MLAALEAPEGQVFEEVRTVALRLERMRNAQKATARTTWTSRRTEDNSAMPTTLTRENPQSRKQSSVDEQAGYPRWGNGDGSRKTKTGASKPQGGPPNRPGGTGRGDPSANAANANKPNTKRAFSTHLESWCLAAHSPRPKAATKAYGVSCHCKAKLLGHEADVLVDTGSVISIMPTKFLKRLKDKGVDLDSMVHMVGPADDTRVRDASGNTMSFLMRIDVAVALGNNQPTVIQFHIQRSDNEVILLGTNALQALHVEIKFSSAGRVLRCGEWEHTSRRSSAARAAHTVTIPPLSVANITIAHPSRETDQIFWSRDNRIGSGVCHVSNGCAEVTAINDEDEPWVIHEGQKLGQWSPDQWYDPKTSDIPGDMLEMQRPDVLPEPARTNKILDILRENRRHGDIPNQMKRLIREYRDVFAVSDVELSQTHLLVHDINVQGHEPIRQRTRPVPYGLRNEVAHMLKDLEERKIIEESSSPWASPIVLVAKKDGGIRLCVDYREVNKVTKKDSYPLPTIDVTLQNLKGKRWFTSLDLASGYWQVPLSEPAKEISAFTTTSGLFQFRVLPFGLTNAPSAFQRLMEKVLGDLLGPEVAVYIDDVLVATETVEQHYLTLEKVLQAFRRANLRIKPQKCKVLETRVAFLGHVIDADGVRTDPDKIDKITNYPRPTNVAELRTFLGMAGYYRKFVLRYAQTAQPLHDLTSAKKRFEWTPEQEKAFTTLKGLLGTAPVLGQPDIAKARDGTRPFFVYTDASKIGVGAVLAQQQDDGLLHPIYFASKALTRAERNYHVTDQEGLAVIFALKKFHYFIYGIPTIVRTDHASLTSLFKRKNVSGRVLVWALELQRYDPTIEYVKGAANAVADALSRGVAASSEATPPTHTEEEKVVSQVAEESWLEQLKRDKDFEAVFNAIDKDQDDEIRLPRHDRKLSPKDFLIQDGQLRLLLEDGTSALVVPRDSRRKVFDERHHGIMGGHFNAKKMYDQLKRTLFWPGMRQDLTKWCKECQQCFLTNAKAPNIPPLKPLVVQRPFEIIGVDILEMGLTSSGNRYILTVIDHFTKYLGAYPVPDKKAETIAEVIFNQWICMGGRWPECILSDKGGEFENALMASLCEILQIQQKFTKGYCPRENGITERVNGTITRMLKKKTTDSTEWDKILPTVVYAYNASPHSATGESPHFLLYGHDPRYPSSTIPRDQLSPYMVDYDDYKTNLLRGLKMAREWLAENAASYRTRMKEQYDKRWATHKTEALKVGDRVYVRVFTEKGKAAHPKLVHDWQGPYRVLEVSQNSALVTLIGENEEPVRVPFDHLIKVPAEIDDTPVKGKTRRGKRRGRPRLQANGVSLTSEQNSSGSSKVLTCSSVTFRRHMDLADPACVDFRCPGTFEQGGQRQRCKPPEKLGEILGFHESEPTGDITPQSPFQLGRVIAILRQTHISDDVIRSRILDEGYLVLTIESIAAAYVYFRSRCYHINHFLESVSPGDIGRKSDTCCGQPIALKAMLERALRSRILQHEWPLPRSLAPPPREVLVLLPEGYERHAKDFTARHQVAHGYSYVWDIQENWFSCDLSAIVLFPTSYDATCSEWKQVWRWILRAMAYGADLYLLPSPRHDYGWVDRIDFFNYFYEELIQLRPFLRKRIFNLLPPHDNLDDPNVPFNSDAGHILVGEHVFMPSAAKRFLNKTVAHYSAYLKLLEFKRSDCRGEGSTLRHLARRGGPIGTSSRRPAVYREDDPRRGYRGTEFRKGPGARAPPEPRRESRLARRRSH
ncbi:hypothetical protein Q1695_007431 [Nippostrongylus brasiliensis]|nr:hypothetical protein Q1695_007431 [Nippostrongylus brasiliensis]